jgi:hypothetical protein
MKKLFFTTIALLFFTINIQAQTDDFKRTIGLSATIQQGDIGIMLPLWVSKKVMIAPVISAVVAGKVGSDYSFGIIPRYYFKNEKLAPFIGGRLGIAVLKILPPPPGFGLPTVAEPARLDYIAGLAFGADYFFVPQLSLGVEAQGNFTKSDEKSQRFGNPGNWNFNTGSMVTVSVYF